MPVLTLILGLSLCGTASVPVARAGAMGDGQAAIILGPVEAEVQSVYDGDTMKVLAAIWPNQVVFTSVRLTGVDTPEIRGKCPEEKAQARAARDRVRALVAENGSRVLLQRIQRGKYAGRVVATVTMPDGRDLSEVLITEGLAHPYDGKTRQSWCQGG
ncbi:MAG: thermonuclease family protein [Rhodospirillum sp.]|nr:thermonuclease family protein [Rhodospirillum sp.]MCF8492023.1 thermonuclease family protein [Rhodospirillum sp.]MCF8502197.1 thermonuclease family protein [Rhodospirillum sp.]